MRGDDEGPAIIVIFEIIIESRQSVGLGRAALIGDLRVGRLCERPRRVQLPIIGHEDIPGGFEGATAYAQPKVRARAHPFIGNIGQRRLPMVGCRVEQKYVHRLIEVLRDGRPVFGIGIIGGRDIISFDGRQVFPRGKGAQEYQQKSNDGEQPYFSTHNKALLYRLPLLYSIIQ